MVKPKDTQAEFEMESTRVKLCYFKFMLSCRGEVEVNLKVCIPFSFYRPSEIIPTFYISLRIMSKWAQFLRPNTREFVS